MSPRTWSTNDIVTRILALVNPLRLHTTANNKYDLVIEVMIVMGEDEMVVNMTIIQSRKSSKIVIMAWWKRKLTMETPS